jgi:CheY-like chemotaxis protein
VKPGGEPPAEPGAWPRPTAGASRALTAVASGEEALPRLAAESHAVLLTDLRLPGADG